MSTATPPATATSRSEMNFVIVSDRSPLMRTTDDTYARGSGSSIADRIEMTAATSFWVERPGSGGLRTEDAGCARRPARCSCGRCYTGISRGTESLVFRGEVPAGERDRMRAPFQAGDFPGPVKYGYLNVGVVEAVIAELRADGVHAVPAPVGVRRARLGRDRRTRRRFPRAAPCWRAPSRPR